MAPGISVGGIINTTSIRTSAATIANKYLSLAAYMKTSNFSKYQIYNSQI